MARPSVLPLPNTQERQIAAGLPAIELANPTGANRAFLRDFFSLVHAATGSVYGASTYLQLLKQFAPTRRPSATTVNEELQSYRTAALAVDPHGLPSAAMDTRALQEELGQMRVRLARLEAGKRETDQKLKELHDLLCASASGDHAFPEEAAANAAGNGPTQSQRKEQDQ